MYSKKLCVFAERACDDTTRLEVHVTRRRKCRGVRVFNDVDFRHHYIAWSSAVAAVVSASDDLPSHITRHINIHTYTYSYCNNVKCKSDGRPPPPSPSRFAQGCAPCNFYLYASGILYVRTRVHSYHSRREDLLSVLVMRRPCVPLCDRNALG